MPGFRDKEMIQMKAVKIILAIIAVVALFVAEALTMGLFALDEATSEESVREALMESDIVSQLVDEALAEGTVNMGGQYGEMMKAIFSTEAIDDFFTQYVTAAVNTQFFGDPYVEVADDELMAAFSEGIDQVNAEGEYQISPLEGELLRQAMQQEVPDLTASLNQQMEQYESLDGDLSEEVFTSITGDASVSSGTARIFSAAICVILCAAVIALCWRSRLGFLWCAVTITLVSLIYWGLATLVGAMTTSSASDHMAYVMAENGFRQVTAAGFAAAVIFFIAFVIFKIFSRNKKSTRNENISNTESTHI